jgi:putative membrane protein
MTSLRLIVAAACAALLAFGAHAQDGKPAKKGGLAKQDAQSMRRLAQADMAEVAAGKVAAQKATHPEVKKFAEHMVDEHSKMLEEGSKLAQAKGMKPPSGPDKKHQEAVQKLEKLSGDQFDRQYMQQMVRDHQDALRLAEKAAKDAKDPELKAHAEKGAPHIKEHLAQARKISQSLSSNAGAGSTGQKKK